MDIATHTSALVLQVKWWRNLNKSIVKTEKLIQYQLYEITEDKDLKVFKMFESPKVLLDALFSQLSYDFYIKKLDDKHIVKVFDDKSEFYVINDDLLIEIYKITPNSKALQSFKWYFYYKTSSDGTCAIKNTAEKLIKSHFKKLRKQAIKVDFSGISNLSHLERK